MTVSLKPLSLGAALTASACISSQSQTVHIINAPPCKRKAGRCPLFFCYFVRYPTDTLLYTVVLP